MNRTLRYSLLALVLVALLLLLLNLLLPYLVRHYLNDKLADMGEYQGHIEDVDMTWWTGSYRLNGLEITKSSGAVRVPFVSIPSTDIAIRMRALWREMLLFSLRRSQEQRKALVEFCEIGPAQAQRKDL